MSDSRIKEKIWSALKFLFTALLFGTQTILNAGVAVGIMTIPLLPYFYYLSTGRYDLGVLETEIWALFSLNSFILGRIIAFIGVILFLLAALQWFRNRRNLVGLFKTGLYSKVRHPQFTGIIITTLGLTIMALTLGNFILIIPLLHLTSFIVQIVGLWFLQVMGYVVIAWFEERGLRKKFGEEYLSYKRSVPFLFPVKNPKRIPEILSTILIVILICIILLLLPYDLIRIYSGQLFPSLPFP